MKATILSADYMSPTGTLPVEVTGWAIVELEPEPDADSYNPTGYVYLIELPGGQKVELILDQREQAKHILETIERAKILSDIERPATASPARCQCLDCADYFMSDVSDDDLWDDDPLL